MEIPKGDFCDAAFDSREVTQPTTLIVILSTPRSGSTFASDLIRRTGVCVPHEYFQSHQYRPALAARWGVDKEDNAAYVQALIKHRTGPTGMLGVNVHAGHLPDWRGAKPYWPATVTEFRYARIGRKDRVSQAVSYYVAKMNGVWSSAFGEGEEVSYDFDEIRKAHVRLDQMEQRLNRFLRVASISCEKFFYEDVVKDPFPMLDHFGISEAPTRDWSMVKKQSSTWKKELVQRYREQVAQQDSQGG